MDSESTFFPGANRRVILGSPTLQTTSRRVCLPIRMPLTGESVVGMPDWLGEAYTAVSKFAREMSPEIEQVADLTLAFVNEKSSKTTGELFEHPSAKAPSCELKAFKVERVGDPNEDPEVELHFKAYIPFSRDIWRWVGEMGGKEVFMAFPSTLGKAVAVSKPDDQPKLIETAPDAEEAAILSKDTKPEADPTTPEFERQVAASFGAKARGPRMVGDTPPGSRKKDEHRPRKTGKELAEYHAEQTAKEARRTPAAVQ